jgi:hypothetical protein
MDLAEEDPSEAPPIAEVATATQEDAPLPAETEPQVEQPAETPAVDAAERDAMRRIAKKMLEKYPLAQQGDAISVSLRNGLVYEGAFAAVDDRFVTLDREGSQIRIALTTLDKTSRATVDNDYRKELIKDLVRTYMQRQGQEER